MSAPVPPPMPPGPHAAPWSAPAAHPPPGSPAPVAPGPGWERPRATSDLPTIVLPAAVALACLVLAVVNFVGLAGFPPNAPVEQVMAFGISVDLLGAMAALIVRGIIVAVRPRGSFSGAPRPGPFGITAAVLAFVSLVGAIAFGVIPAILHAADGSDQRYMELSGGMFFLGFVWATGVVFAVSAHRPGRGKASAGLAYGALGVLMLVAVFTVGASVAYGMGLTE